MLSWVTIALVLNMGAVPALAETITVTVDKMAFTPTEVSAKIGDTIEWVNKDRFAHTATVKGGWEVVLPVKKSGSLVVEKAEAIDYYCRFHPNMKGRITVAAK
ncbi:cupredoxin domain-containing protein [Aminobacter sp. MDW-2]|uniref:cupredoxin domain-containing protein n=1 Tax=Aminobacter sp. MDW-2 TaxID=2666139 RepID=UPI0012AF9002|nr:cupredoxin domain-containing protein [Aminobacter sp. MDW-2]MRX36697.1 amicyanin [Aminobacter sp. MDW-2]QNH33856.1 cupredoxin domain-containing protein [Aminobacter sp. MDW-2]